MFSILSVFFIQTFLKTLLVKILQIKKTLKSRIINLFFNGLNEGSKINPAMLFL